MSTPTAFIAGATGLTGREVVRLWAGAGHRAVAHVRPDSSHLADWRERFEGLGAEVDATPWEEPAMTESLARLAPTHVFALLGTTKKRGKRARTQGAEESYETVDYGLTALLRRAAEACGSGPRFVYLSSMGVTPTTRNAYLAARAKVEGELRGGALPYTIARPSIIVGDRDEHRAGEAVSSLLLDGALGVVGALGGGRLREKYRSTDATRLAAGLVALALDPEAAGAVAESDELRARGA